MKTRITALLIALFTIITASGCSSNNSKNIDTGSTFNKKYNDYMYWSQTNQLRVVANHTVIQESTFENKYTQTDIQDVPEKEAKTIEVLKDGIISFFKEFYEIDLTYKITKQEVKVFTSTAHNDSMTMGYVDPEVPNVLNLNQLLFTNEYKPIFENTYIHEALHQLGFIDKNAVILTEGFTDAFTDMILCYIGRDSYTTSIYFDARTLAYQIICVDRDIPHLYLETENFSITKRISERLSDIEEVFEKNANVGKKLELYVQLLYSDRIGDIISGGDNLFFYAYDAQEIVRSYCQTFEPSNEQIDYIRNHYLLEDFEEINVIPGNGGYYVDY